MTRKEVSIYHASCLEDESNGDEVVRKYKNRMRSLVAKQWDSRVTLLSKELAFWAEWV
jgi:hypothetical protein